MQTFNIPGKKSTEKESHFRLEVIFIIVHLLICSAIKRITKLQVYARP